MSDDSHNRSSPREKQRHEPQRGVATETRADMAPRSAGLLELAQPVGTPVTPEEGVRVRLRELARKIRLARALLYAFSMKVPRHVAAFASFAALVAACGGSVIEAHDGAGGIDGGAGGGSLGSGGSGGNAGSGGAGGNPGGGGASGGNLGGAASGGRTGSGGAGGRVADGGGALPAACTLPQDAGPCDAIVPAWWHNPTTGICEPFTYGGCEGNANHFASRAACQATCRGGAPDFDFCSSPSDCELISARCCGSCEPVDERAFLAINRKFEPQYQGRCETVDCGPCPAPGPGQMTSQYFVATCETNQCTVVDIRQTTLTDCKQASDCTLRLGATCCESCGGSGIVSLNRNADLISLVCGTGPVACPTCAPQIPPGYGSSCTAGRCTVNEPACTAEHPCPL